MQQLFPVGGLVATLFCSNAPYRPPRLMRYSSRCEPQVSTVLISSSEKADTRHHRIPCRIFPGWRWRAPWWRVATLRSGGSRATGYVHWSLEADMRNMWLWMDHIACPYRATLTSAVQLACPKPFSRFGITFFNLGN